ncbi:N-alpha-acetyltransferase 40 [Plutella xylostella]|uniref:N-alpha-acetyltransferase 40 n=1 Tax=Plutella xylostella TaxID=51655 RepID=UPI002032E5C4|nr:N-alpha-acetyltransferase 40 [Plutella xylostella]
MGKKPVPANSNTANKHKEKRLARKLEQRRIADGMTHVTSANRLQDIASLCKELLVYKNDDLEVEMYIQRVSDLEKSVLEWAIDLTERNMKTLYETCAWGWNKTRKVDEMTDDAAWYLIAKHKDGSLLAFSHFRFDMDFGEPVLYCYEVQMEPMCRRRGLGQRVLAVLERLARATRMHRVRLTALTHNAGAAKFFKACGYIPDDTSPAMEEAAHYEILSKETGGDEEQATLSEGLQACTVTAAQ